MKIIKRIRRILSTYYLKLLPSNGPVAALYYFLFDSSFVREMKAVYSGKRQHVFTPDHVDSHRFTLRRNVHRLEKALIMRPRRESFAADYIGETITSLASVYPVDKTDPSRKNELKWFMDVLGSYFDSVTKKGPIEKAYEQFTKIITSPSSSQISSIPFKRSDSPVLPFGYEELFTLFKRRRSVRWFLEKSVERDLIDKAILAALQSPSACNRQPFEFRILEDDRCKEVSKIPMGMSGYGSNVPVLAVLVGKLDAYFDERDRHVIYVDGGLVSMSFMLALETLGLSSCPINWPDIERLERKMDLQLNLSPWERPIMLMAIGYPDPDGGIPYSEKSPLEAMCRYN
ncbi:nitroreductase family protein [Luteolibacter pohnpeiensis]|uniref:Nitroreductase family protein n=1 Tax=Luteolibacter pohnpeiensis TaxID=454153 RepID=A0A934S5Z5_9BACT|nr:nitroreductase family protein [Luteolibacter pohnpeiensis]MBK1882857.1 nitroreductase family protein [Luteolibacter pohnpeiensis]